MDNNKKLFDGLLKADGIDPAGISETEREIFREMLESEKKHNKHLSWKSVGALWVYALAITGLCLYEKFPEPIRIPFIAACIGLMAVMVYIFIAKFPRHNKKLKESNRKISKLYYLVNGKHRGFPMVSRKDGKRIIHWFGILRMIAVVWTIMTLGAVGFYYLLCQQWMFSSTFASIFHILNCTIVSLSFVRYSLKTPLDELTEVKTKPKQLKPPHRPDIWRIIMTRKVTKFAAAAVIMTLVMLGAYMITGSIDGSTKIYAMSDLPDLLNSARTIHMKGMVYYADMKNPGHVISSEFETLVDLENERWRNIKANVTMDQNGTRVTQIVSICDGGKFELFQDPKNKTASYVRLSSFGRKRLCRQSADSILYMTCGKPELLDLYEVIGQEKIDGKIYDIWQLLIENDDHMAMNVKMQSWLSPETGDVAKVIIWNKTNGTDWVKMADITTLDIDTVIPEETFLMDVPDGYKLTNTMETAPNNSIGGPICGTGKYYLQAHILFAMKEGSMIACWSCRDPKSDVSQAPIFDDLQFGGELPQLPCVVEGLKTSFDGREVIYDGYHLGYTQKDGRFYEWTIYFADKPIETRMNHVLPFELLYKKEGKKDSSCRINLHADMQIDNAKHFNDFILGAMAEFTDSGEKPEDITYQDVQELVGVLKTINDQ